MVKEKVVEWEAVRLSTPDNVPLERLYLWQNSVELRDSIMGFRFPMQRSTTAKWLTSSAESNAQSKVVYSIFHGNEAVGLIYLHTLDHFQRKAKLTIYIAEPEYRNRGIGFISTALLLDYAFNGLDLRKIGLEVVAANLPAVALYQRLGFHQEGCLRGEYYLGGKSHDVLVFGMLQQEFSIVLPPQAHRLVSSHFSTVN